MLLGERGKHFFGSDRGFMTSSGKTRLNGPMNGLNAFERQTQMQVGLIGYPTGELSYDKEAASQATQKNV